jgi:spore maturation protein SpmA
MLNYIWLGLITLGIAVAVSLDVSDQVNNKYRNYESLKVEIIQNNDSNSDLKTITNAEIKIKAADFSKFYGVNQKDDVNGNIKLSFNEKKKCFSFYFIVDDTSPNIWNEMAKVSGKENDLTGKLFLKGQDGSVIYAAMQFEKISFSRMKQVTNSVIEYATKAAEIALGLIGIMALWLGVMKIAEQAGLISIIANAVKPITKFLFPDVPQDHPAIGSIIMNISANMLGLGNAATPFGLKAMEELDKINPAKGTATNAMCTFLAINTAGLTIIPATAIAIRAASGSSDPAIIIGTSFFGASCATIVAIIAAKTLEKFPMSFSEFINHLKSGWKFFVSLLAVAAAVFILSATGIFSTFNFINTELIKTVIQVISILAIPLIIFSFVLFGIIKKIKIYEVFVEGAKEGFNIAVRIIPFLVAMLVGIGIFRVGGAMDFLTMILSPVTNLIGFPAEALPMALMRPLSGSGSLGIMSEIMAIHGPDSFIGILVSTIMGSTETTFYVLALYFGSVGISKMRHSVAAGVLADLAGILASLFIVKLIFG